MCQRRSLPSCVYEKRGANDTRFGKILDTIVEDYGGTLKKLADNPVEHKPNDTRKEPLIEVTSIVNGTCQRCKQSVHGVHPCFEA